MTEQSAGDTSIAEGLVPEEAPPHGRALRTALKAAWLAVFLGLTVQTLIVIAKLLAGGTATPLGFVVSLGQGITWSVLVCAGVAIGSVAAKAKGVAMGVLGLIAGPAAWGLAKGVQKALQALMGLPQDKIDQFFLLVTGIKGVEYAILGTVLGHMIGKKWARLPAFAGVGLSTGIVFCALAIWLTANHAKTPMPALIGLGVNEVVFPLGCSLVIYAVQALRERVAKLEFVQPPLGAT